MSFSIFVLVSFLGAQSSIGPILDDVSEKFQGRYGKGQVINSKKLTEVPSLYWSPNNKIHGI